MAQQLQQLALDVERELEDIDVQEGQKNWTFIFWLKLVVGAKRLARTTQPNLVLREAHGKTVSSCFARGDGANGNTRKLVQYLVYQPDVTVNFLIQNIDDPTLQEFESTMVPILKDTFRFLYRFRPGYNHVITAIAQNGTSCLLFRCHWENNEVKHEGWQPVVNLCTVNKKVLQLTAGAVTAFLPTLAAAFRPTAGGARPRLFRFTRRVLANAPAPNPPAPLTPEKKREAIDTAGEAAHVVQAQLLASSQAVANIQQGLARLGRAVASGHVQALIEAAAAALHVAVFDPALTNNDPKILALKKTGMEAVAKATNTTSTALWTPYMAATISGWVFDANGDSKFKKTGHVMDLKNFAINFKDQLGLAGVSDSNIKKMDTGELLRHVLNKVNLPIPDPLIVS